MWKQKSEKETLRRITLATDAAQSVHNVGLFFVSSCGGGTRPRVQCGAATTWCVCWGCITGVLPVGKSGSEIQRGTVGNETSVVCNHGHRLPLCKLFSVILPQTGTQRVALEGRRGAETSRMLGSRGCGRSLLVAVVARSGFTRRLASLSPVFFFHSSAGLRKFAAPRTRKKKQKPQLF